MTLLYELIGKIAMMKICASIIKVLNFNERRSFESREIILRIEERRETEKLSLGVKPKH